MPEFNEKTYTWCTTIFCYLSFVAMGSLISIPGPTLKNIEFNMLDEKEISLIFVFRPIGFIFGSIISSLILDRVKRAEPVLIIEGIGMSFAIMFIGFLNYRWKIYAMFFFLGLCVQGFNSGINVLILKLWGSGAAGIFQGLHFSFGVGALLAPLIAAPFVPEKPDPNAHPPVVAYPYIIVGCNSLVVLMSFAIFNFCTWKKSQEFIVSNKSKSENAEADKSSKRLSKRKLTFILVIIFISTFFEQTCEITFPQAIPQFSYVAEYKMTQKKASYLASAFWAPYMTSRFFCIFLTQYLNIKIFIIHDLICMIIAGLVLVAGAYTNETCLWIGTVLYGWSIGTLFPGAMAWVSNYIEISFIIGSMFFIAGSLAEMTIPHLLISNAKTHPKSLYIFMTCASMAATVFYFILGFIFAHTQPRFTKEDSETEDLIKTGGKNKEQDKSVQGTSKGGGGTKQDSLSEDDSSHTKL